jgi:arsenate reductase
MSVPIDLLVTPDCPNAEATEDLLRKTIARLVPNAQLNHTLVRSTDDAERLAFPGSPTVRIEGDDIAGPDSGPPAFACRTYEDGAGIPPQWLLEARLLRALQPHHLLFLCVANSARSQMAEALAKRLAPEGLRISSAGSAPSRLNPFALAALAEIGIDAGGQRSKAVDEIQKLDGPDVDVVITLCAEEVCPVWLGEARRVHWPLPDPAAAMGTGDEILASFRRVRDELQRRLLALLG